MKTKVVSLDVYGTMLPSIGDQVKRKGLDKLLAKCQDQGLVLCTCSDAPTKDVLSDFEEAKLDDRYFDEHFEMPRQSGDFTKKPKDFKPILNQYNLSPEELLVIGDREVRDIDPARRLGCKTIHVPEYRIAEENDYDISKIEVL